MLMYEGGNDEKSDCFYSIRAVWGKYNSGMYAFIVNVE